MISQLIIILLIYSSKLYLHERALYNIYETVVQNFKYAVVKKGFFYLFY